MNLKTQTPNGIQCYQCMDCLTVNNDTEKSTTGCAQCSIVQVTARNGDTVISRICFLAKTCVPVDMNVVIAIKTTRCETDLCNSGFIDQSI
ncbi:hypothetical protein EG68_00473 [Paragonimus skrjabini miyazakii]|uniref:Uncharacterized protein n=1 Tax=Paragonimus skrjabini miyazakii TaxID=59628 RepID=A0A8S9Z9F2_9TREM|nr:hypothetical protein EG68_00473 [Paragonimus skrjabini miyazakii]